MLQLVCNMCKEMNVLAQLPEEEPSATKSNCQTFSFSKELPHFTAGVQASASEGATASGGIP